MVCGLWLEKAELMICREMNCNMYTDIVEEKAWSLNSKFCTGPDVGNDSVYSTTTTIL